jgi:hypothetical protein
MKRGCDCEFVGLCPHWRRRQELIEKAYKKGQLIESGKHFAKLLLQEDVRRLLPAAVVARIDSFLNYTDEQLEAMIE